MIHISDGLGSAQAAAQLVPILRQWMRDTRALAQIRAQPTIQRGVAAVRAYMWSRRGEVVDYGGEAERGLQLARDSMTREVENYVAHVLDTERVVASAGDEADESVTPASHTRRRTRPSGTPRGSGPAGEGVPVSAVSRGSGPAGEGVPVSPGRSPSTGFASPASLVGLIGAAWWLLR